MTSTTIYKFAAQVDDTIAIPVAGEVTRWLHVAAIDPAHLVLWAEVQPGTVQHEHTLHVRGTGHQMTGGEGRHVGTVVAPGGPVWHVFEPKAQEASPDDVAALAKTVAEIGLRDIQYALVNEIADADYPGMSHVDRARAHDLAQYARVEVGDD